MNTLLVLLSTIVISAASPTAGDNVSNLAKALDPTYPIWKINGKIINEKGAFELIIDINNSKAIEIPNFEEVLNNQDYMLLSCYGNIIPHAIYGYVVGTANCCPSFGRIMIYDGTFQKISEIESQKVVKINLDNLLGGETRDIVTWEDHHYGTNTTRRVLNIYRIDENKTIKKIFQHDLVDATGAPGDTDRVIHYRIDYHSQIRQNKIIVINEDDGSEETFTWNGAVYKGEECQVTPADAGNPRR